MAKPGAPQPLERASAALLGELADLVPGPFLAAFVADLREARERQLNGSAALKAEISFGRVVDAWAARELRPRKRALPTERVA